MSDSLSGQRFLGELSAMNVCLCLLWLSQPLGRKKPLDCIVSGIKAPNYFLIFPFYLESRYYGSKPSVGQKCGWGGERRAQVISLLTCEVEQVEYMFLFSIQCVNWIVSFFTYSSVFQCTYSASPSFKIHVGSIICWGGASQGTARLAGSSHVPVGLMGALEICFT